MPLKVVQWGVGNVGKEALAAVLANPELELVGLWRHSAEGAGTDAGELLGIEPTGVKATRSLDEILALDADCGTDCADPSVSVLEALAKRTISQSRL